MRSSLVFYAIQIESTWFHYGVTHRPRDIPYTFRFDNSHRERNICVADFHAMHQPVIGRKKTAVGRNRHIGPFSSRQTDIFLNLEWLYDAARCWGV